MSSFNYFSGIKRMMVKMVFIAFLAFSPSVIAFSNPIVPPPLIIEIYFSPDGWQIEMMNDEFSGVETLDNIWLYGIYDSAQFVSGIEFFPGEPIILTQDDLTTPLTIEQSGDHLTLYYINGGDNYILDMIGLAWGSFSSEVRAPAGEESIAYQWFDLPYDEWDYWAVKELPNTIGYNPWQVSKRATFSGYVMDKNYAPLPGIMLHYCSDFRYYFETVPTVPWIYTDSAGNFYSDEMYCKSYYIQFRNADYSVIGDTSIYLEPDSANYFEFKLDTLLTGINELKPSLPAYSISNHPNPSSSGTTIIIETTQPNKDQKGVIKVYNENGYIVDIIPVNLNNERQEIAYNLNDKSLSPGMYFYNLEIRNHMVASGKMLITR